MRVQRSALSLTSQKMKMPLRATPLSAQPLRPSRLASPGTAAPAPDSPSSSASSSSATMALTKLAPVGPSATRRSWVMRSSAWMRAVVSMPSITSSFQQHPRARLKPQASLPFSRKYSSPTVDMGSVCSILREGSERAGGGESASAG